MSQATSASTKPSGSSSPSSSASGKQSQALSDSLTVYLRKAAKHIKTVELSSAILKMGLVFVVMLLALVLIDHWVWSLNRPARFAAWVILFGGSLVWFLRNVLPIAFRSIHPAFAAKRIETTMPELKNSLMNWWQLSSESEATPRGILAIVGRHAVAGLKGHDASALVDHSGPIRLAAFLFGCFVLLGIYFALGPKSGIETVRRILFPWAEISAPSRVQIIGIKPGHATVTQGTFLPIVAELRGLRRDETVSIRYETTDGQIVDQRVPMDTEIEGLSYRASLGSNFGGIQQAMRYQVLAGDAISELFNIQVQTVPLVVIDQIEYRYPAYMAMKNRIIHGDGRIEAPEGTVVVMHCLSNQPMQKARIEFDPEVEDGRFLRASSVRDLDVSGKSIDGQWMLELDDKRTNPTIKSYRVRATNDIGESNLDPVVHPIKILADLAPEVRWIGDNPKSRPLPANGSINVDLRSLDPDYGLREITVIAKHQGRELFQETLFQDEIGDTATITASVFLDAKERELKPGMVIELTAIAKDNRQRPGTENWEPNISKSSTMEITIVEPSKNPPKAEPKETQAERPEQLKPKLNQPKKDEASNKPKKEPTPQDKDCEGMEEGGSNQSAGSGGGQDSNSEKQEQSENPSKNSKKAEDKNQPGEAGSSESSENSEQSEEQSGNSSSTSSQNSDSSPKPNSDNAKNGKTKPNDNSKTDPTDPQEPQDEPQGGSSGGKPNPKSAKPQSNSSESYDSSQPPSTDRDVFEKIQEHMKNQDRDNSKPNSDPGAQSDPNNTDTNKQPNESSTGQDSLDKDTSNSKDSSEDNKTKDDQSKGDQSKGDQSKGDQSKGDQSKGDQSKGDQSKGDQSKGDQSKGDQSKGDQSKGDQSKSDQSKGDQSKSDQSKNDQSKGDRSKNDQSKNDQSKGDQSKGDQSKGDQSKGDQSNSDPSKNDQSKNDQSKGDRSKNDQSNSDQSNSDQSNSDQSNSDQSNSDQSNSDQSNSDQSNSDQSKGDQSNSDQSNSDQSKNDQSKYDDSNEGSENSSSKSDSKGSKGKSGQKGNNSDNSSKSKFEKESSKDASDTKPPKGAEKSAEKPSEKKDSSNQNQTPGSDVSDPSQGGGKEPGNQSPGKEDGKSSAAGTGEKGNKTGSSAGGSSDIQKPDASDLRRRPEEQADEEYAKKATDMVLDYLKRQKDQPDPDLLKKLNWTEKDLKSFVDRWQRAKDDAMRDPKKQKELEDTLRSLGLGPASGQPKKATERKDNLRGMQEEGTRIQPPDSLRLQFDAFKQALQKGK